MQDNGGGDRRWSGLMKGGGPGDQGSGSLNCVMFAFGTHLPLFSGLFTIVADSRLKYYTFHSKAPLCQQQ